MNFGGQIEEPSVGTTNDRRDPFEILGVAPGTEWRVIEAAYEMLAARVRKEGDGCVGTAGLADVEWAYEALGNPEGRLSHVERALLEMIGDGDGPQVSGETGLQSGLKRKANVVSVLVSAGLFGGMLGAIWYALYFVGAIGQSGAPGNNTGPAIPTDTNKFVGFATEVAANPEVDVIGHTATVEALYATATRGASLDYAAGRTATMEAFQTSLTPTPVKIRACPNVASVNVRTGPGIAYRAIGYILAGDCVDLTGRDEGGEWIVINHAPRPSSNGGWVAVSLMNVEGDIYELGVVESE